LVKLATEQAKNARAERADDLAPVVIEAALSFCHDEQVPGKLHVAQITERVNVILKGRRIHLKLEPETVGVQLNRHGLCTKNNRDSAGKFLYLLENQKRRIHELARAFDVPSVRNGKRLCHYCAYGSRSHPTGT
jgi:hypothetical protein